MNKYVLQNAKDYLGADVEIKPSTRKYKKYMILKPDGKWSHFGDNRYEDYTQHRNDERKKNYLARAENIKGNWKNDKYSPNNLSIHILWN